MEEGVSRFSIEDIMCSKNRMGGLYIGRQKNLPVNFDRKISFSSLLIEPFTWA
jgi:hypothetical protein